jgi:hypothetical protein
LGFRVKDLGLYSSACPALARDHADTNMQNYTHPLRGKARAPLCVSYRYRCVSPPSLFVSLHPDCVCPPSLRVSYLYRMRDLRRASVISMRSLLGTTPAAELSFSSSRLRILPAMASLICSFLLLPAASKQCRKSRDPCTHARTHAHTDTHPCIPPLKHPVSVSCSRVSWRGATAARQ